MKSKSSKKMKKNSEPKLSELKEQSGSGTESAEKSSSSEFIESSDRN
jgi:hypothetical protein